MNVDTAIEDAAQAHLLTCVVATTGSMALAAIAHGYTRLTGSFVADGFAKGMEFTPGGFSDTSLKTIASVVDGLITTRESVTPQTSAGSRSLTAALPAARLFDDESADDVDTTAFYISGRYLGGPVTGIAGSSPSMLADAHVLYQVIVRGTVSSGRRGPSIIADAIKNHFGPFLSLDIEDGSKVKTLRDTLPFRGSFGRADDGRPQYVVTIPLRLYHRLT